MSDPRTLPVEEADGIRKALFLANQFRLEEIAVQTIKNHGLSTQKFNMVCINTKDATWITFLELLIPNRNWQTSCDESEAVVNASAPSEICENITETIPDLEKILSKDFPEGVIKVFIFDAGGVSIRAIDFRPSNTTQ